MVEDFAHPVIPAVSGLDAVTAPRSDLRPLGIVGEIVLGLGNQFIDAGEARDLVRLSQHLEQLRGALVQHEPAARGNVKRAAGDLIARRRSGARFAQDAEIDLRRGNRSNVLFSLDRSALYNALEAAAALLRGPLLTPYPHPDLRQARMQLA